ncbi:unnamed protein product [Discosporangium mesarthrocarpum]
MTTRVGTPYYIAPEVLEKLYDKACDLWSIGVITYILLCGYPPFFGDNDYEIFQSVQRVEFQFLSPEWDEISDEAKDFISKLLLREPAKRLTAGQALAHPWFEKEMDKADAAKNTRASAVRLNHRLRRFAGANAMKKIALNVIAKNLGCGDEGHLRKVFQSIDLDNNGEITVEELQQVVASEGLVGMQAEVLELLQEVDMDGNHRLDYNEFLAATLEKVVFLRDENLLKAFNHFDFEGKGHISCADLMQAFGTEDRARKILNDIDSNRDGIISFEEFKDMMNQF